MVGPGTVHRAIEQAQRLYWTLPEDERRAGSVSRWSRDEPKSQQVWSRRQVRTF
jgi:hypothetical protein